MNFQTWSMLAGMGRLGVGRVCLVLPHTQTYRYKPIWLWLIHFRGWLWMLLVFKEAGDLKLPSEMGTSMGTCKKP